MNCAGRLAPVEPEALPCSGECIAGVGVAVCGQIGEAMRDQGPKAGTDGGPRRLQGREVAGFRPQAVRVAVSDRKASTRCATSGKGPSGTAQRGQSRGVGSALKVGQLAQGRRPCLRVFHTVQQSAAQTRDQGFCSNIGVQHGRQQGRELLGQIGRDGHLTRMGRDFEKDRIARHRRLYHRTQIIAGQQLQGIGAQTLRGQATFQPGIQHRNPARTLPFPRSGQGRYSGYFPCQNIGHTFRQRLQAGRAFPAQAEAAVVQQPRFQVPGGADQGGQVSLRGSLQHRPSARLPQHPHAVGMPDDQGNGSSRQAYLGANSRLPVLKAVYS